MQDNHTHKIYTVSELNTEIKSLLETRFPFVWVYGEISNFRQPISGHYYFTLKDDSAQINAVMFRGQQKQLKYRPEDGMSVTGMGRLSVYEPRGAYQIILEYMEPSGIGALQIAFEKLKQRLSDQGLFDTIHKKKLPFLPKTVCILTSPSGAVVHDILNIIDRRFSNMMIEIIPIKVQGPGAEEEIISGLNMLNDRNTADAAILARGGGSGGQPVCKFCGSNWIRIKDLIRNHSAAGHLTLVWRARKQRVFCCRVFARLPVTPEAAGSSPVRPADRDSESFGSEFDILQAGTRST